MDIQKKLKQFRLNNNLTLEEAAEYTEVSRATLGRIEQGLANPGQATIDKINTGIAKWNVEQVIWGFKDPDDPSFDRYTADEAQDILEFNKYFLSELDLELKLSDSSVEIWAGDAGYRASIGDLQLIKEQVVKQYAAIFNERFPLAKRSKERPIGQKLQLSERTIKPNTYYQSIKETTMTNPEIEHPVEITIDTMQIQQDGGFYSVTFSYDDDLAKIEHFGYGAPHELLSTAANQIIQVADGFMEGDWESALRLVVKTVYAMHLSGPEFEEEMDKMDKIIAELKSRIKETP